MKTVKLKSNTAKQKKLTVKKEWESRFLEKIKLIHKRNLNRVVDKILGKVDRLKYSLVSRSKKAEVKCTVTVEELRALYLSAYAQPCKYCGRTLNFHNIVVDHIKPISKGGESIIENLQVICKTSNSMKGSLDEANFQILLDWLKTIPEELNKDISIRLSRGIH